MRAGTMRKRFTIQALPRTRDAYGQISETWSDVRTVWGSLEPLVGRELLAAQEVKAATTHRVRIRFIPDVRVTPRHRFYIASENRIFNITAPLKVAERNFDLEIMVEEFFVA